MGDCPVSNAVWLPLKQQSVQPTMNLDYFSQRALELMYSGALYGVRLIEVYCTLKGYEAGEISERVMQYALDRYDPELEHLFPFTLP